MAGYAENAPETDGMEGLAAFLNDTPQGTEVEDEAKDADELTGDEADNDEDANAQSEDADAEGEPKDEAEDAEDTPTPERTFTVKEKGEDGSDIESQVTESELVKGYMRQANHTRGMQALARDQDAAVKTFMERDSERQQEYIKKAEATRAAIYRLAGLDQDISHLATSDPAAWVAENQRRQNVQGTLHQLDQHIQQEQQQVTQRRTQHENEENAKAGKAAWAELSKRNISREKVATVYADASAVYGLTPKLFNTVYEAGFVLALQDAAAYRALKAKAPEVTKKAQDAPRLPNRQATPAAERQKHALNSRFSSGRAKLNDLAAYLNS
jgi:hypothetical protein